MLSYIGIDLYVPPLPLSFFFLRSLEAQISSSRARIAELTISEERYKQSGEKEAARAREMEELVKELEVCVTGHGNSIDESSVHTKLPKLIQGQKAEAGNVAEAVRLAALLGLGAREGEREGVGEGEGEGEGEREGDGGDGLLAVRGPAGIKKGRDGDSRKNMVSILQQQRDRYKSRLTTVELSLSALQKVHDALLQEHRQQQQDYQTVYDRYMLAQGRGMRPEGGYASPLMMKTISRGSGDVEAGVNHVGEGKPENPAFSGAAGYGGLQSPGINGGKPLTLQSLSIGAGDQLV